MSKVVVMFIVNTPSVETFTYTSLPFLSVTDKWHYVVITGFNGYQLYRVMIFMKKKMFARLT